MQEHVKQEKHLMAECDCVFLVRLVAGFQDSAYLYMVLEAAMGGEFFLYMQVRLRTSQPRMAHLLPAVSHVQHGRWAWCSLPAHAEHLHVLQSEP
jgi:hypothetical protein